MLVYEGGHFYVCGDCTMAEDVYQTLKHIIQTHGEMTDKQVEAYMLSLRVSYIIIIINLLLNIFFNFLHNIFRMKIVIMKIYLVLL